jgi:Double-GTPase 2
MADFARATCRVEGCGGPREGICINNLSFEECPDVVVSEDGGDTGDEEPPVPSTEAETSVVPSSVGDSLDVITCDTLLRANGAAMIGIVAGPAAGKTTLVATIYERIHRGKSSVFGFAGSETIRGYEERCHLARLASGGIEPDTERTKTWAELSFTHLELANDDVRQHVMFSDRSGEHFDNVLNRPDDVASFRELARASHIWIVIDLKRLSESGHSLKSELRRLVMILQSGNLFDGKHISVIGTKADLFSSAAAKRKIQAEFNSTVEDLQKKGPETITFNKHMIGCRPAKGSTEFGDGIDALLSSLFEPEAEKAFVTACPLPGTPSQLDLLMQRLALES